MTPERLAEIKEHNGQDLSGSMNSGCTDYACYCHFAVTEMLDELSRLEAVNERIQAVNERIQAVNERLQRDLALQVMANDTLMETCLKLWMSRHATADDQAACRRLYEAWQTIGEIINERNPHDRQDL